MGWYGLPSNHTLFRSRRLHIEVTEAEATDCLQGNPSLKVGRHGDEIILAMDEAIT
jgi:hypothetical protein